ncbi:MAG: DMT family transporter [Alphaproteobacteria bacterium]
MLQVLPQKTRYGVILIVLAALVISTADVIYKIGAQNLSLWQVFALRGFIVLPGLVLLMHFWTQTQSRWSQIKSSFSTWAGLRGFMFALSLLLFYAALPNLSLSTLGAAHYTAPLIIAMLSSWFTGEPVGKTGWIGVTLGFIGLLALIQPGSDSFSPWIFLPLLGALAYAATHLITRAKCQNISAPALAFSQNFFMMIAGFIITALLLTFPVGQNLQVDQPQLFSTWPALGWQGYLVISGMSILTLAAGIMIARAYQVAPAPTVGAFEYSYLLFAAIWDAFFGTLPNMLGIIGAALIIFAGLIILRKANP